VNRHASAPDLPVVPRSAKCARQGCGTEPILHAQSVQRVASPPVLTVQKISSLIGRYLIGLEAPNPVNLQIRLNERQDIRDGVLESEIQIVSALAYSLQRT
jgi:hypothetical protein